MLNLKYNTAMPKPGQSSKQKLISYKGAYPLIQESFILSGSPQAKSKLMGSISGTATLLQK
jgi:hypothetical protein